jgi:hypothetical protein
MEVYLPVSIAPRIPAKLTMALLPLCFVGSAFADVPMMNGGSSAIGAATMSAAPPARPTPKPVPASLIRKDKISVSDDPHLPDVVKARYLCAVVTGSYKLCIGTSGEMSAVDPIMGIPGADEQIVATVRKWRYKPQALPICFVQFFEFHIDGGPEDCNRPEMVIQGLRRRVELLEGQVRQAADRLARLPSSP